MHLRSHFIAAHRAVTEGYPLKGYLVWYLTDNVEWCLGHTKRFGMVYVNDTTLERTTPKPSTRSSARSSRATGWSSVGGALAGFSRLLRTRHP